MEELTAKNVLEEFSPGAVLEHVEALAGGVSAQTFRFDYFANGRSQSAVVSIHSDVDWQRNPNLAADEFELLRFLKRAGYPVATPLFVGRDSAAFDRPYLVVEYLSGHVLLGEQLLPRLTDMAFHLSGLHAIPLKNWPFATYPPARQSVQPVSLLDERMQETKVRTALEGYVLQEANSYCLLHCDYWAGNLLWNDEGLVAVLDWEDFGVGDPLADLGNARVELAMQVNMAAVETFTAAYLERSEISEVDLPYWDLVSALFFSNRITEFADDEAHEALLYRRMNEFVDQALSGLGR